MTSLQAYSSLLLLLSRLRVHPRHVVSRGACIRVPGWQRIAVARQPVRCVVSDQVVVGVHVHWQLDLVPHGIGPFLLLLSEPQVVCTLLAAV